MRKSLFVFCPVLFGGLSMFLIGNNDEMPGDNSQTKNSASTTISCLATTDENYFAEGGKFIRVMPGWGDHFYAVSTKNDSAQIYFNQGLSMYYSYHSREAVASFKEAAKFDTTCAMAYWGQALAMGPTYNYGYAYKMNTNIPAVLQLMNRYSQTASPKEKDLIAAMNKRYNTTDAADKDRKRLNAEYADALKPLVAKYTDDLDIKALYTDAIMLIHAWDFWYNDGTPKAWTSELVKYCEDILSRDPHHPAGLHYYIHVTEASRKPEVALASADSLIKLFPGVAHMVHMSSHEYERIGYYAQGVVANEKADASLVIYDSLAKGLLPQVHVPHYYAVESYCALSGAMYKKGIYKSLTLRQSVAPTAEATYLQFQYMYPELTMVRLGKWQDILNDTAVINPDWIYAGVLNDFAKGMAYTKTGDHAKAEMHLAQLREKRKAEILNTKFAPHTSSPQECADVAENILLANIRFQQKKYDDAIATIRKAINAEDSLIYSEPKVWMLPARQYLGAFLIRLNRPKDAEKVYREDLVWNPGNGWSLLGLHQALQAQGKTSELKNLKKLYTASFSEADVLPNTSAY